MLVQQLSRVLSAAPLISPCDGIVVRHYEDATDAERWVELINLAFRDETPPMRCWTIRDFEQRVMQQPGWTPGDLFLAYTANDQLVGSVSIAFRRHPSGRQPALHLMAVRPDARRQGIARMLVAMLESTVWHRGYREIVLETHAGWQDAAQFYAALGYQLRTPTR